MDSIMIKKILIAVMFAGSLGVAAPPATAAVNVVIRLEPPPMRYERIPSPRRGYVWAPGYWDWRGQRHVWAQGNWMRERPGYTYNRPGWHQRGGNWEIRRGSWARSDHGRHRGPGNHGYRGHGKHDRHDRGHGDRR